ncbi:flagellar hook-length control protein FliK [Agarivorans gilvus]|uniref:Flagellar hook-length control protein FliK n=1 Tax=Agarivorans gilvus TaxID=680279 RepID=A0ABQ1I0Z2_9ALTE|nr:flagellar hook-length control protein FliK [Agarivorans gilvus]GGA98502.1 flagellar hook-length control protein FliK [Agarivorans gilvus]
MEFLLTDSANSSPLGSLANAAVKPSAKAEDFAHLVKDLQAMPRAAKAVGLAVEKQMLRPDSATEEPGEPANPLELLKQLDNAKQIAEEISKSKEDAQSAQAELDDSTAEPSPESLDVGEDQQQDAEQALAPEAKHDKSESARQSPETGSQPQAEQSGRDLPPKQGGIASSASNASSTPSDAEHETAQSTSKATATNTQQDLANNAAKSADVQAAQTAKSKQAELELANNVGSSKQAETHDQSEQIAAQRVVKSEAVNAEKGLSGANVTAQPEDAAKQKAATQILSEKSQVTDKAQASDKTQVTDKIQVTDKANEAGAKLDGSKSASAPTVTEAEKSHQAAKTAVNSEQKPLATEPAKAAQASATSKQAHSEQGSQSATVSGSELSRNEAETDKSGPKSTPTLAEAKTAAPSATRGVNDAAAAKTQVEQQASNEAGVKLVSEQANSNEHAARLASEAKPSAPQSSPTTAKNTGVQAPSATDKSAVNQAAFEAMSQQSDQQDNHEQPEQQTQGHTQHGLQAAEAARQPEAASLFRAASGLDGLNRTESHHQELGLKQAQLANQVNDKANVVAERLNPAHYQAPAELNQRVQYMLSQGMQKAEIRLDPAELGSMHVRLQMNQDQQVSVHIQVQNPQAKEALEQTMPRLRDMLQQQGIELGQSQVNQQHSGSASQQGQGQASFSSARAENTQATEDLAEQDLTAVMAKQTNSDGIDYYA